MLKRKIIFFGLCSLFLGYSWLVYHSRSTGKASGFGYSLHAKKGKLVFQKYNCVACHQIYGLGGYMGPDLTNMISRYDNGEETAKVFLKNGTARMPDFKLSENEITCLIEYLKYLDKNEEYPVKSPEISRWGTVKLRKDEN